jgi:periplasmic divalent cation tolerance protein
MAAMFLYITAADVAEARRLGRTVVEERLAACANILPGATSIYRWDGAVTEAEEAVLIVKSTEALAPALTERLRALHSYDVPCIIVVPIAGGSPDFLAWIEAETSPA